MTSVEFIKNALFELVDRFPTIYCRYEYDMNDFAHNVEISPSIFRSENMALTKAIEEIDSKLFQLYPYEALFIIDETTDYPIKNVIFEKKGKEYLALSDYWYRNAGFLLRFLTIGPITSFIKVNEPIIISSILDYNTTKTTDYYFSNKSQFSDINVVKQSNTPSKKDIAIAA